MHRVKQPDALRVARHFVFLLLLAGCRKDVEPVDAASIPPRPPSTRGRCAADTDCKEGWFCICKTEACSVEPRIQVTTDENPDGLCMPREDLRVVWIPSRADGGWVIEAEGGKTLYRTSDEAWRRAVEQPVE